MAKKRRPSTVGKQHLVTELAAHLDYLADCLDAYLPSGEGDGARWAGKRLPADRRAGFWMHLACSAAWRVERILNPDCIAFGAENSKGNSHLRSDGFGAVDPLEVSAPVWFIRGLLDALYEKLGWKFLCALKMPVEFASFEIKARDVPPTVPPGYSDDFRLFARLLRAPVEIPSLFGKSPGPETLAELEKWYGTQDEHGEIEWSRPVTVKELCGKTGLSNRTIQQRIGDKGPWRVHPNSTKAGYRLDLSTLPPDLVKKLRDAATNDRR